MMSLSFLKAVAALSSPPRASASFVVSPWSTLTVCGPGLPPNSKLIGSTVSRANFVSVPVFSRVFLSLPVRPLPPRSPHPLVFLLPRRAIAAHPLPGTVATTSILATLILSVPCLPFYRFDHCGVTLSMSAVLSILRSSLARLSRTLSWIRVLHGLLWHARVWSPLSRPHSHARGASVQSPSLLQAIVFHSSSSIPGAVSAHVGPTPCPQCARNACFLKGVQFRPECVCSDGLKVRLKEIGKQCPFDAFTESHLKSSVIALSSCFKLCVPSPISSPPCSSHSLGYSCLPVRILSILSA